MTTIIQVGGMLDATADQNDMAAATEEFVKRVSAYPGYRRAVQLFNPETRHFQGLIYFDTNEAAGDFLEARGYEEFGLFEQMAAASELTLARLRVIE